MELRDNPIQQALWERPVADVLAFEHLKAAENHSLKSLVAKAIERFEMRSEGLHLDAESYGRNLGYNDRLRRLTAYARNDPWSGNIGYLTHAQIANDLAALIAFAP